MSRLESIKDDLKLFDTTTQANVEWLIQRLEIAQKALESANNKLGQISSKDFANGELRYEAATIIQGALQQLKE